jgi:hypothetical protein
LGRHDRGSTAGDCTPCCCCNDRDRNSTSGGRDNCSQPDKCNCPIMGRDSAVVAMTVVAVHGSNQLLATLAIIPPVLTPRSAAAHFVDYRQAGPPTDLLIRFERLLI